MYELLERGAVPGAITATKKKQGGLLIKGVANDVQAAIKIAWPSFTQEASFTET